MSGEYPRGFVELFEDFTRDNVTSLNQASTGGSQDITDKHGGWFGLTTASGGGDYAYITGELAWEVDEGHPLIFEVRQKIDDVSVCSAYVGMTDAVNDNVIIEDEGGTLESDPDDAFGFMLEGPQDETWQAVAVDSGTDETQDPLTNGTDAADGVIQTLRMEANPNDSGTVLYFIDGELVKTKTEWFDSSIVYCPAVAVDGRSSVCTLDIDYIYVCAPRS